MPLLMYHFHFANGTPVWRYGGMSHNIFAFCIQISKICCTFAVEYCDNNINVKFIYTT